MILLLWRPISSVLVRIGRDVVVRRACSAPSAHGLLDTDPGPSSKATWPVVGRKRPPPRVIALRGESVCASQSGQLRSLIR